LDALARRRPAVFYQRYQMPGGLLARGAAAPASLGTAIAISDAMAARAMAAEEDINAASLGF
jgi:hypothetical protein